MNISHKMALFVLVALLCMPVSRVAFADKGDALVQYNMALAAQKAGDVDIAYGLFKRSCMAPTGSAEACLAWGEMAIEADNVKDIKRALGSAVMLDPNDIRARFSLAVSLLKKQDWVWAAEHLSEALPNAKNREDRSLLQYYLGYAKFKNGDFHEAIKYFALASHSLPPKLSQKCNYYRGMIAQEFNKRGKAYKLFTAASRGVDAKVESAALSKMKSQTAFPRLSGVGGQIIGSLGVNTHPATSFLETSESKPVLQSILRGDLVAGTSGYEHGFFSAFTVYREQNWAELGSGSDSDELEGTVNKMAPEDMNVTLFILQGAYVKRGFLGESEIELRIGIDEELQYMDRLPVLGDPDASGNVAYEASDEKFELYTLAVASKIWLSWNKRANSTWSTRFKIEHRPNYIDSNRSTNRFRLRLLNTQWLMDRTLQFKFLLGGRYDRAYKNLDIIKYDRLLPEFWVDAKWKTPVSRLSVLGGIKLKYNWYLNSKVNDSNSFRPAYLDNRQFDEAQNSIFEKEYYNLPRHDFEWEVVVEAQVRIWQKASLGLRYFHHHRYSNMDFAPRPMTEDGANGWKRVSASEYGYSQDVVTLELKQGF